MVARCENIGKNVLPVFRSLIARELINTHKLTQVQAAEKLGTTQAAISQYVNSKRAFRGYEKLADMMPQLQALAVEVAKRLANGEMGADQITVDFCKLCTAICCRTGVQTSEDFSI